LRDQLAYASCWAWRRIVLRVWDPLGHREILCRPDELGELGVCDFHLVDLEAIDEHPMLRVSEHRLVGAHVELSTRNPFHSRPVCHPAGCSSLIFPPHAFLSTRGESLSRVPPLTPPGSCSRFECSGRSCPPKAPFRSCRRRSV